MYTHVYNILYYIIYSIYLQNYVHVCRYIYDHHLKGYSNRFPNLESMGSYGISQACRAVRHGMIAMAVWALR
jgi:hypothetical protein